MARRNAAPKREILPDPIYGSKLVTKLINSVMRDGKKSVAEKVVYGAFELLGERLEARNNSSVNRQADNVKKPTGKGQANQAGKNSKHSHKQGVDEDADEGSAGASEAGGSHSTGSSTAGGGKEAVLALFEKAVNNARPLVEVRSRRVGGSNYQVPNEVSLERGIFLALRMLVKSAGDASKKHGFKRALAEELEVAARGEGVSVRKRQEIHKMAEANRAFSHYH